jgi:hypothetical protein
LKRTATRYTAEEIGNGDGGEPDGEAIRRTFERIGAETDCDTGGEKIVGHSTGAARDREPGAAFDGSSGGGRTVSTG